MSIKGTDIRETVRRMQKEADNICLLPNTDPSIIWVGRPCVVRRKRATFHQWCEKDGRPYAIVEWESGHIELVTPNKVRFTDRISFEERMKELREGL